MIGEGATDEAVLPLPPIIGRAARLGAGDIIYNVTINGGRESVTTEDDLFSRV